MPRKPHSVFLYLNDSGGLALGDAIVHLPFLRALKEWSPETQITISPAAGGVKAMWPLFEPYVHQAMDGIPKPSDARFDWAFDLVGESVSSAFAVRRLARHRFYSTASRGWLHLPRLPVYHGKYIVRRHLGLLAQATGSLPSAFWPWPVPTRYAQAAASLLPPGPAYVAIAPGAGNAGQGKRWPLDRYVALARLEAERGRVPVIVLGPEEAGWESHFAGIPSCRYPLAENDARATGVPSDPTLTVALARRVAAAVTNCCGAGHMFALGGAPLLTIFGPTNHKKSAAFAHRSLCIFPSVPGSRRVEDVALDDVQGALEFMIASGPSSAAGIPPNCARLSFPEISMNPL